MLPGVAGSYVGVRGALARCTSAPAHQRTLCCRARAPAHTSIRIRTQFEPLVPLRFAAALLFLFLFRLIATPPGATAAASRQARPSSLRAPALVVCAQEALVLGALSSLGGFAGRAQAAAVALHTTTANTNADTTPAPAHQRLRQRQHRGRPTPAHQHSITITPTPAATATAAF
jgi:hypothetical protein